MAVAEEAVRRGLSPVILTRGYKGRADGPCFVTKGYSPLLSADDAGDEAALMAEKLKGVPIIKGADRYGSGLFALRELGYQCTDTSVASDTPTSSAQNALLFILDDGFQHWALSRDKDVVLLDAGDPFGNRKLLPSGILREPMSALSRADIIVLSKCRTALDRESPAIKKLIEVVRQFNAGAPVFCAEHSTVSCRRVSGEEEPLSRLTGTKVFGFCALAHPGSFRRSIESTGAGLAGFKTFRDHYPYRQKDINSIRSEAEQSKADWIVTTEKDIIKCKGLELPGNVLTLSIAFTVADGFYDAVFS
jgi:tetraacyldisaccharide 4'-kinase